MLFPILKLFQEFQLFLKILTTKIMFSDFECLKNYFTIFQILKNLYIFSPITRISSFAKKSPNLLLFYFKHLREYDNFGNQPKNFEFSSFYKFILF